MKRWVLVLTALALAFAVGVPLAAGAQTPTAGPTRVRAVHAAPGAPAVDVYLNGARAFSNLDFTGVTRYAPLPGGSYAVSAAPSGPGPQPIGGPAGVATATPGAPAPTTATPVTVPTSTQAVIPPAVLGENVTLNAGTIYSAVVVGTADTQQLVLLTDDLSAPPAGQAKVRFMHASPDAPAVDVAVTGGQTLFSNVAYKGSSSYKTVPAGTVNLEVREAGTNTVVLTLPNVTLGSGVVYTIYATGLVNGTPSLQAIMAVESVDGQPVPAG